MRNNYTFSEFISTTHAYILTKLFYNKARLVRRPIFIRGKSSLKFDKGLTLGHGNRFDLIGNNEKTLFIGKNCEFGDYVHIVAREQVIIGDNCLLASKVFISDTNHGNYSMTESSSPDVTPNKRPLFTASVSIGNNVWIGENVCVLLGVTIGNGCIIGANSVVNHNIPDNCIAVGSPARVIKKYDFKKNVWVKYNEDFTD